MTQKQAIQLFEERKIRTIWDEEKETWYFSIVDTIEILTDSVNPTDYLKKMRKRDPELNSYIGTNCPHVLMTTASGKKRKTLAANTEQLFRLIQSIPSPKAEPFKIWMAQVASERLDQMQDPELSIEQAMTDYLRLGYSENWINQRIKTIEIRKELTDEWKRTGVEVGQQYAILTDIITQEWSGMKTKQYKQFKGLKKENLRDNMTNKELVLNMLAELSTKEISEATDPKDFGEQKEVARKGGAVARAARTQLEESTGQTAISKLNAKNLPKQIK